MPQNLRLCKGINSNRARRAHNWHALAVVKAQNSGRRLAGEWLYAGCRSRGGRRSAEARLLMEATGMEMFCGSAEVGHPVCFNAIIAFPVGGDTAFN